MLKLKSTKKNILMLNCFFVFFIFTSLVAMYNILMILYNHKNHLWELGYIIHIFFNLSCIALFMKISNFLENLIIELQEQKEENKASYKIEPKENE